MFYSIKDRKGKISAVVKDILILDIGTSVHTQYDSNDVNRYIAAFIADNELEGSSIGLIHSHHRMGAFFSGEDMQTLASEGKEKNWFLSLVVDSSHTYEARITRKVVYNGTLKGSYTDPDGNTIYTGEKKFTSTQIETYSLDVKYPKSFLKFPESPLSTAREISRRKAPCMTANRDWLSEHRDYESIIPYQPSAYMKSTGISRGITQRASCQSNDIDTGVCKVLSGFLRLDDIDSIVS